MNEFWIGNTRENAIRARDNYHAEIMRLEKARAESENSWIEEIAELHKQISSLKTALIRETARSTYYENGLGKGVCTWFNLEGLARISKEAEAKGKLARDLPMISWEDMK
jgi:hypothetical protein